MQRLNGEWVGEGVLPSSAIWQLQMQGRRATLVHFSADSPQRTARFDCRLSETPFTFSLGAPCEEFIGCALDEHHLVITGLDDGNDVIFSRPGLAELTARDAYENINPDRDARFSLSRWVAA